MWIYIYIYIHTCLYLYIHMFGRTQCKLCINTQRLEEDPLEIRLRLEEKNRKKNECDKKSFM